MVKRIDEMYQHKNQAPEQAKLPPPMNDNRPKTAYSEHWARIQAEVEFFGSGK